MTERKKWYSGPDVYKWIGKELLGLRKVSENLSHLVSLVTLVTNTF